MWHEIKTCSYLEFNNFQLIVQWDTKTMFSAAAIGDVL